MSILFDSKIREAQRIGAIRLDPYDDDAVQPASYDIRLDSQFVVFHNHAYAVINPGVAQPDLTNTIDVGDGTFVLHPGEFVLASTQEVIGLGPRIAGAVNGKSSLGRLGLVIHATAGFIDPGFTGHITLELSNVATLPIRLTPGMKIGQVVFYDGGIDAFDPYGSAAAGSHYQGQRGPTPSRSWERFDIKRVRR
jgi:dCTP deaminase